jgi:hypothetical protein
LRTGAVGVLLLLAPCYCFITSMLILTFQHFAALLLRMTLDDALHMYLLKRPKIVKIKLLMPTSGCKKVVEIQILVKNICMSSFSFTKNDPNFILQTEEESWRSDPYSKVRDMVIYHYCPTLDLSHTHHRAE